MKKVFLMTGLLAGLGLATMAQTSPAPAKKEHKKETHQKSDATSKAGHEKKAPSTKKTKTNKK
jgi:hypothetical protein